MSVQAKARAPRKAVRGSAVHNYVGGRWTTPSGTETLSLTNPATGESLGDVLFSNLADVGSAVEAAKAAFPGWRETPAVERVRVLFRLRMLLEQHAPELAKSLTREHGKTLGESRAELQRAIENVEHACGIPTLMMGDTLEDIAPGIDCETIRQPLGVFAIIAPYNFPVMIPMWFWPYAVATGNTVVLKPSERDPLTHQRIVDLATEAGLPAGVLNVVHGGREVVTGLLEHPDIVGVSFVGSSEVARFIYATGAKHGKRVQALGGAKNHMIVLPDADIDLVGRTVVSSIMGSAGQRCLAGSVVMGVGEVYDALRESVLDRASAVRVGNGLDDGVDMGPVISAPHRARVLGYIERGLQEGAKMALDGRDIDVPDYPNGQWIGPTFLTDTSPEMVVGREEIFGPVGQLNRVRSIEEAIALMHRVAYGNATSIFTTNGGAAREFRYRAGINMLGVNIGVAAPMAMFPFGGSRASFYGDIKAQGHDAVSFYTDQRVVISRWEYHTDGRTFMT